MNYRNDLCCKRKVAYDMESAAARWDTHPGTALYICTACGFIHFASDNDSLIDRAHGRALADNERRNSQAIQTKAGKSTPQFGVRMPSRYISSKTTCRVDVWAASKASIGEILRGATLATARSAALRQRQSERT